mmetsp:Transcript_14832/g.36264  ORF Transcript_14832/g.36264 Transcript_14832/m.36264 type:complete len:243 (+) Transcript_14832:122-850(+)
MANHERQPETLVYADWRGTDENDGYLPTMMTRESKVSPLLSKRTEGVAKFFKWFGVKITRLQMVYGCYIFVMIAFDVALNWVVELALVQKERHKELNLAAMLVVDIFTYSYILLYTINAVTNENTAKLFIATTCFFIHWTTNLAGFLLKPNCPVKQQVCTFISATGTVLLSGLIVITYLEVKAMGWRSFLSLGTEVRVMKILRSYQAFLAASQLCILLVFNVSFLSVIGIAQHTKLSHEVCV